MLGSFLAGALAAALVSTPSVLVVAEPAASAVVTATRSTEVKYLPGWGAMETFGELRCPPEAPRLEDRYYNSGYFSSLPQGIEVVPSGSAVDVFLAVIVAPDLGRPFGLAWGTTSNYAGLTEPRTVHLVIHCTNKWE